MDKDTFIELVSITLDSKNREFFLNGVWFAGFCFLVFFIYFSKKKNNEIDGLKQENKQLRVKIEDCKNERGKSNNKNKPDFYCKLCGSNVLPDEKSIRKKFVASVANKDIYEDVEQTILKCVNDECGHSMTIDSSRLNG